METDKLKRLLNQKFDAYHRLSFLEADPLLIPHQYTKRQDVEVAGFFAAILAWGHRAIIIKNVQHLMQLMDNAPHDFLLHHLPKDRKRFLSFVHRTFNATDLLYCIEVLSQHYKHHDSLQEAFVPQKQYKHEDIGAALVHFHQYFFSQEHPQRSTKHIATPLRGSACKRLCMYLRWMVRQDHKQIDFGIWHKIKPAQLVCPLDVHVARVAYRLQLIDKPIASWQNAIALTNNLKHLDADDPVKYDFALFGLGSEERY